MFSKYVRGMVYWCKVPKLDNDQSIAFTTRPVIVVSNDIANFTSPNITIVPLTTNTDKNPNQSTHCIISISPKEDSLVLAESITTVSKTMLGDFMGMLSEVEMKKIDNCVQAALGLIHVNNPFDNENVVKEHKEIVRQQYLEDKAKINKGRRITGRTDMAIFIQYAENHTKEETMAEYGLPSEASIQSRLQYYRNKIRSN